MTWLYKTIKVRAEGSFAGGKANLEKLDAELNALGAEGWELVTAFSTNEAGGSSRDIVMMLKRPAASG